MKTTVGLFDTMEQARQAAPELEAAGVRRGDISIAAAEGGGVRVSVTTEDALAGRVAQILERVRGGATAAGTGERVAIPIVEEELQVGKREVQSGGARIQTSITETPVQEQVTLREEHATVERHPVNRPATQADLAGVREGTIEVTERAEVPVVSKEARVVEEVVVGKEASERTETVQGTVRRTDVDVEELNTGDTSVTGTSSTSSTTTPRP